MHIVCTTTSAAQVLDILLSAGLRPIHDVAICPVLSTTPPMTYTLLVVLTALQLRKLRAIADTAIIGC